MSLIYMTPAADATPGVTVGNNGVAAPRRRRNCLYLGAKTDAKNRDKLHQWGITHILNATPSKDASIQAGVPNYFEKSGAFSYKRIPVYDAATSNFLEFADEIVNFISTGLCHGSVLIHCQRGVSRSATCALLYLISKASMTLDDALTLVRRRRPGVEPIPAFIAQLRIYEDRYRSSDLLTDEGDDKGASQSDSLEKAEPEDDQISSNQGNGTLSREESLEQLQSPTSSLITTRILGPTTTATKNGSDASAKRLVIGPSPPPSSEAKRPRIGPQREAG